MNRKIIKLSVIALFALPSILSAVDNSPAQKSIRSDPRSIPRAWDEEAVESMHIPLADAKATPTHISSDYYDKIPERKIYKSYPVYAPDDEPPGYMENLQKQEPEIIFDPSKLKTESDWIRAGEMLYDSPVFLTPVVDVRDLIWYEQNNVPIAEDGTLPFARYVVREKGKVELGVGGCATCHNRLMPDGSVLKGVQGNFPSDRVLAYSQRYRVPYQQILFGERVRYAAGWMKDKDPFVRIGKMTRQEIAAAHEAVPPGVQARHSASPFAPVQIPDLIGVKDRLYLERTGLLRHRNIGDLMRYIALVQSVDVLCSYGDFKLLDEMPDPTSITRYNDAQLYAISMYIYSLKPPPNPNRWNSLAAHGKKVFESEGCALCHTPPLYTNNKLTPVAEFKVPEDHLKKYDIMPISVGTDPELALYTRKGTGYYKVPSLKGVWYRGPFEHSGSVATLEDWFDPKRLNDDYIPTGFRGYGVKTRAVKGHEYGLKLSLADRKALIAFLKTL